MSQEVQVISSDGKNLGILNTQEAINMAKNEGLDLCRTATSSQISCRFNYHYYVTAEQ